MEQCKDGDMDAYCQLVRQYQHTIYNCAFRILSNSEDAADVTQTAFLKMYERLESYDTSRSFFSWMYRVTVNEAIDQKRKRRRFDVDHEEASPVNGNPDNNFEANETRDRIQAALNRLSDDARVVIVLRHFSDCSYSEMAEILEIPERTVRSRLYSARQRLKQLLL